MDLYVSIKASKELCNNTRKYINPKQNVYFYVFVFKYVLNVFKYILYYNELHVNMFEY